MRRNLLLLATLLGCALVSACVTERPPSVFSPIEAIYLDNQTAQNPPRVHYVRLTITNHQERPIWYIITENASRPLPERGVLTSTQTTPKLALVEHAGSQGTAYEVRLAGGDFRAFRLPARGKLEFTRLMIGSNNELERLRTVEVMEATDLFINGTDSLTELLPANAQTSAEVRGLKIESNRTAPERILATKSQVLSIAAIGHRFWMAKLD